MKFLFLLGAAASYFGAAATECEFIENLFLSCSFGRTCSSCADDGALCGFQNQLNRCHGDNIQRFSTDAPTSAPTVGWAMVTGGECPSDSSPIFTKEDCFLAAESLGVPVVGSSVPESRSKNAPFGCTAENGDIEFAPRGSFDSYDANVDVLCNHRYPHDDTAIKIAAGSVPCDSMDGDYEVVMTQAECRLFAHDMGVNKITISSSRRRPQGCFAWVRPNRDTRFYYGTSSEGAAIDAQDQYDSVCKPMMPMM